MKETNNLILPPSLKKGDTIGLVAPAGPVLKEDEFIAGVKLLSEMGFQVKFDKDLLKRSSGYLAGPDERRAGEFHDLWRDPEVKGVLAVRGGYGSLRMLPCLDMDLIRQHPKFFVGFSDISVLLTAILKNTGLVTFHGPMLTTLPKSDKHSVDAFFNTLTGRPSDTIKPDGLEILVSGNSQGKLLGGNLTNLAHLVATPYEIVWQNAILFLEDVGEDPYRIDRMLTHLKEAGRLQHLAGLILGNFKNCGAVEQIWQRAIELLSDREIPIWANFPTGHGKDNHILPLGIQVEMDSQAGRLLFLGHSVGT